jgi:hypothetical protein
MREPFSILLFKFKVYIRGSIRMRQIKKYRRKRTGDNQDEFNDFIY